MVDCLLIKDKNLCAKSFNMDFQKQLLLQIMRVKQTRNV